MQARQGMQKVLNTNKVMNHLIIFIFGWSLNIHEVEESVADVHGANGDLDEAAVGGLFSPGVSLGNFNLHVRLFLGQPLHDGGALPDEGKAVVSLVGSEGDSLQHGGSVQAECAHMSICIFAYFRVPGKTVLLEWVMDYGYMSS
jgi:hypothetical protein